MPRDEGVSECGDDSFVDGNVRAEFITTYLIWKVWDRSYRWIIYQDSKETCANNEGGEIWDC